MITKANGKCLGTIFLRRQGNSIDFLLFVCAYSIPSMAKGAEPPHFSQLVVIYSPRFFLEGGCHVSTPHHRMLAKHVEFQFA